MSWAPPIFAFALSLAGTGLVLRLLRRRAILDHPNERSSHRVPTPRGAGLAVVPAAALVWAAIGPGGLGMLVPALALALMALSWLDDLRGLPVGRRLLLQGLAVAAGLAALPQGAVFQGLLPPAVELPLLWLGWLWFVNLFNFMDGIDGLAGVETVCIGAGVALAVLLGGGDAAAARPALVLAAAACGFLVWNWPPAKIFLGDAGSVPLGFLLGFLLLSLAAGGFWAAALLLPLYHLADATVTLARRAFRGEKVWQAHAQHFYQQAARRFGGHAPVALRVLALNLWLTALAAAASLHPALSWPAVVTGGVSVALLLWYFGGAATRAPHAG